MARSRKLKAAEVGRGSEGAKRESQDVQIVQQTLSFFNVIALKLKVLMF